MYKENVTTLTSRPVILGLALTGSITQFTKLTVGRPRPGACLLGRGPFSLMQNRPY
jgi:hypothetical protein